MELLSRFVVRLGGVAKGGDIPPKLLTPLRETDRVWLKQSETKSSSLLAAITARILFGKDAALEGKCMCASRNQGNVSRNAVGQEDIDKKPENFATEKLQM